ncbi:MAG: hypothetical protein ACXWP4_19865, partial [Polyangiales bacterium]
MRVQIAQPSATPQQIEAYLRSSFPRYSVISRAGIPIVGDGAATGVMVKPSGPGYVTLGWAFPSMAAQILVTLTIVLTGILPGLLVFGIVWLVVKGGVARLKQEVSTVLAGGAPMQLPVAAEMASGPAPMAPGPFAPIGGVVCIVMALLTLGQSLAFAPGLGSSLLGGILWIAIGVGALMLHGEEKRAFETRVAQSGASRLVIAIAAILQGLQSLPMAFSASGFWLVRGLFMALFWLATGGLLIAVHSKKPPAAPKQLAPAVTAAGVVLALFGLFTFYDFYDLLDRGVDFGAITLMIALRGVLWLVLGGVTLGRAAAMRKVDG